LVNWTFLWREDVYQKFSWRFRRSRLFNYDLLLLDVFWVYIMARFEAVLDLIKRTQGALNNFHLFATLFGWEVFLYHLLKLLVELRWFTWNWRGFRWSFNFLFDALWNGVWSLRDNSHSVIFYLRRKFVLNWRARSVFLYDFVSKRLYYLLPFRLL
jgi:hypothetical protein